MVESTANEFDDKTPSRVGENIMNGHRVGMETVTLRASSVSLYDMATDRDMDGCQRFI